MANNRIRTHGPSGYNNGCRCEICRDAQRERARRQPKPPPKPRKVRVPIPPEERICEIDGCVEQAQARRKVCSMHHTRLTRHGDPLVAWGRQIPPGLDLWTEAFINKYVVTDTGCWEWTGHRNPLGYGKRSWKKIKYYAHRQSYILAVGPIPDDMTVDHLCFNPPCINPSHLRLLTHSENAGNQRQALAAECSRGHSKAEHYHRSPSGNGYCRECQRDRRARLKAAA